MRSEDPGYLRPEQTGDLSAAEDRLIAAVCPGLGERVVADGRADPVLWGPFVSMQTGSATDPEIRHAGASGGALSAILGHLLADGVVDAVVQTAAAPDLAIGNATVLSTDLAGILQAAGSRYAPSAPLAGLRALQADGRRFAFVGKPCDAAALRALIREDPDFERVFPVILSFFCAGVPSNTGARALLAALEAPEAETVSFRYRGNGWPGRATAKLADGSERSMSYHDSWGKILSKHVQHRCKICADGTGVAADIVCADAWESDEKGYPIFAEAPGISLIVARTTKGAELIAAAQAAGRIDCAPFDQNTLATIQPGQRERRRALLARLVALRLAGRSVPQYEGLQILAAARQNPLSRNLKNFLGMLRRSLRPAPVRAATPGARPLRVCLIMHSTRSDNLGVGALTVSEIAILRDLAQRLGREIEITVLDWKDARTPYVGGPDIRIVDLDGRFLKDPRGFFATVRRSDMVIDIGAGDSFADIYGSGRLVRMYLMKFLTHLARTPLVVAPQTIGPFHKGWSKRLALLSLRLSALVATRDAKSTEALRALGYRGAATEASDVALRLPFTAPGPRPDGPPRVGINVSGLLMAGGYTGKNEFGIGLDYPGLIRDLIRTFQSRGAEVHLVSHVIVREGRMVKEDDYRASAALAEEFPGTVLAPAFDSPSEAKSYIAGLDFFLGARMHACIAAFSSGVPVVPMAYSRKFEGLFGTIGYHRTVDCATETGEAIAAKILAGYDARETLAAEAAQALARGREKLLAYEQGLQALMEGIRG